jgi:hypothetical protein
MAQEPRGQSGPFESNSIIEAYKKDIDRTLLRENLKLTPEQRILKLQDFVRFVVTLQEAGGKASR